MKKFIIAALLALPVAVPAQTVDNTPQSYNVQYEKEHLVLQNGSGVNVVDYDIEWPDIISFNDVNTLKRYISNEVFNYSTTSLDSAINANYDEFGKPVTGKFKTIPDDDSFCYVTEEAKILSYEPNRWIAYVLKREVEPGKKSMYDAKGTVRVIVYDIQQNQILLADDMLRKGVMQWALPDDFYNRLFAPLKDDIYYNLLSAKITGVWIDDDRINMSVQAISNTDAQDYMISMPYQTYRYALSKEAKKLVERNIKKLQPQFITLPLTWKGDTIYNNVEKMPEFKGGQEGLKKYLSLVSKPDVPVKQPERVYVAFVVDKEGKVQNVSVVSPAEPAIDEHAANVIKNMPTFTPGQQNGKPVCVRLVLPISYKP